MLTPFRSLVFLVACAGVIQGPAPTPPSGHPFGTRLDKLELLATYFTLTRDLGWTEPYAMAYAAWALNIPGYDWHQGLGPIIARIP